MNTTPISTRRYILLLASMTMLPMIATDIYLPSMPAISDALHSSHSVVQLSLSVFMIGIALGQLLYGSLIDQYGRKPILTIGVITYILASIACIFVQSVEMLIILRLFQSLGASGVMVIGFAATRDIEHEGDRARLNSYVAMSLSISPMFAPIIGAFLELHFGWRTNFIALALYGIFVFIIANINLRESVHFAPSKDKWQGVLANYKSVLKSKYFWCYNGVVIFAFCGLMSFILNSSYIFMDLSGLNPRQFAMIFASNASMMILGNIFGMRLRDKIGMDRTIFVGALLLVLSAFLVFGFIELFGINAYIILPLLLSSLGVIIAMPTANARSLTPFPKNSGTAAAVMNCTRLLLAALTSTLLGFWLNDTVLALPILLLICGIGMIAFITFRAIYHIGAQQ